MYERFSENARNVMQLANQEAHRFNHEYIGTEHIVLGIVKLREGRAIEILTRLEIDPRKIRLEVEKLVQTGPEMVTIGKLPQTPRTKKVIEFAIDSADAMGCKDVGTEHLLLGLLREKEGVANQVLEALGVTEHLVHEHALEMLGVAPSPSKAERIWSSMQKILSVTEIDTIEMAAIAIEATRVTRVVDLFVERMRLLLDPQSPSITLEEIEERVKSLLTIETQEAELINGYARTNIEVLIRDSEWGTTFDAIESAHAIKTELESSITNIQDSADLLSMLRQRLAAALHNG